MKKIKVELSFEMDDNSEIAELIQEATIIGLQVMALQRQNKPMSLELRTSYNEVQLKLKTALRSRFELKGSIENMVWDSTQYLSRQDHAIILAPAG